MVYSSYKVDHTDVRNRFTKSAEEIEFDALNKQGKILLDAFDKKTRRSGLAQFFYQTGHMIEKLPKGMFANMRLKNLLSQVPGFCKKLLIKQLAMVDYKEQANPSLFLQNKFTLDYKTLSLFKYVLDEEVRDNGINELFEILEPKNKKDVVTEIDRKKEKEKQLTKQVLIRYCLDNHISKPLEKFTPTMSAKDHLQFLSDRVIAEGLTPETHAHFEQVLQKAELKKEHVGKSIVLAKLSLIASEEDNLGQKLALFYQAIKETSFIKTDIAKQKALATLQKLATIASVNDELYEVFLDQPDFSQASEFVENNTDILSEKPLQLPVMISKNEIVDMAEKSNRPATRSKLFERAYLLEKDAEKKELYYTEAVGSAALMKSSGARMFSLRNNAPNKEWQATVHNLFLRTSFDVVLADTKTPEYQKLPYDLTTQSETLIAVHRNDTVGNQRKFFKKLAA